MSGISIVYTVDDNYTMTFLSSVLSCADNDTGNQVEFFVISLQNRANLAMTRKVLAATGRRYFLKRVAPKQKLKSVASRTVHDQDSVAMYLRLFLPELLPGVKRVIYLDSDLLVRRDLSSLWRNDLEGNVVAAVDDPTFLKKPGTNESAFLAEFGGRYFNSGVMVVDLERWRQEGITEKASRWVTRYEVENIPRQYWDQSPLNRAIQGRWKSVCPTWNCSYRTDLAHAKAYNLTKQQFRKVLGDAKIWHFMGEEKPWLPEYSKISSYALEFQHYQSLVKTILAREMSHSVHDGVDGAI